MLARAYLGGIQTMQIHRRATLALALSAAIVLSAHAKKPVRQPSPPRAVATFESVGLYWSPGTNPGSAGCALQYRKLGETAWRPALAMWYDSRNGECRGSVVQLVPATMYEFQLSEGTQSATLTAATWSEQFPIAQTIIVGSQATTLNATRSGSPSGYVLYQADAG